MIKINLLKKSVLLLGILFTLNLNAQEALPLANKKVLFVYGGWEGHEPKKFVDLLLPWLNAEGAIVDTFNNLNIYANQSYMESVDLIIQAYTMAKLSAEQEKGLLTSISNGTGIAGWHGGLGDAFRNNVACQFMVGGQWVSHPGDRLNYTVNFKDKTHQITIGLSDFNVNSEQYYMLVDPNVKVLATTTFLSENIPRVKGCTMPVVWIKMYGKGRVFYSSLGHAVVDLKTPEVLEILKRGIRWSSQSKYVPVENLITPVY